MAKGSAAKDNLMYLFSTACGDNFIGTEDGKKFYFWSKENGEKMQVCVTMTIPKTPMTVSGDVDTALDFEDEDTPFGQMNEDEVQTLDRLVKELDL